MSYSPRELWLWWRSLKLPWRRKWLVGVDLSGNTFWEFKDALHASRHRRIVRSPRRTQYSDVQLAPQWIQWLRHTRSDPPSVQEQQLDRARQVRLKELAAEADKRWASKPSFLDPPSKQQPSLVAGDQGASNGGERPQGKEERRRERKRRELEVGSGSASGDEEQPAAWAPQSTKR